MPWALAIVGAVRKGRHKSIFNVVIHIWLALSKYSSHVHWAVGNLPLR